MCPKRVSSNKEINPKPKKWAWAWKEIKLTTSRNCKHYIKRSLMKKIKTRDLFKIEKENSLNTETRCNSCMSIQTAISKQPKPALTKTTRAIRSSWLHSEPGQHPFKPLVVLNINKKVIEFIIMIKLFWKMTSTSCICMLLRSYWRLKGWMDKFQKIWDLVLISLLQSISIGDCRPPCMFRTVKWMCPMLDLSSR